MPTNAELMSLSNTLQYINQNSTKMPVKFSYALAINAKRIEPYMSAIESSRKVIVERHCKQDDDGKPLTESNNYVIDPEKKNALDDEMAVFNALTNDALQLHKVSIDSMPETLEPQVVYGLLPMIIDEDDAAGYNKPAAAEPKATA